MSERCLEAGMVGKGWWQEHDGTLGGDEKGLYLDCCGLFWFWATASSAQGLYAVPGIEPGLEACKASIFLPALSLQPKEYISKQELMNHVCFMQIKIQ